MGHMKLPLLSFAKPWSWCQTARSCSSTGPSFTSLRGMLRLRCAIPSNGPPQMKAFVDTDTDTGLRNPQGLRDGVWQAFRVLQEPALLCITMRQGLEAHPPLTRVRCTAGAGRFNSAGARPLLPRGLLLAGPGAQPVRLPPGSRRRHGCLRAARDQPRAPAHRCAGDVRPMPGIMCFCAGGLQSCPLYA